MKCDLYLAFKSFLLTSMLLLTLLQLNIPTYFSISTPLRLNFGLQFITLPNSQKSYSDFSPICESSKLPNQICSNLSNLELAGKIFTSLLSLDCFVLFFSLLANLAQHYAAEKILSKKAAQLKVTNFERRLLKLSFYFRGVIVMHPVLVNLGGGLWIHFSAIEKYSSDVQLGAGVVIGIFQGFLSLLVIAGFLWEISSGRRRILRLKSIIRGEKQQSGTEERKKKSKSDDVLEEKSIEIEISV